MPAYYNEIDPYAAQWLRQLIAAGHIADGVVDERSIEDIHPIELREFTQCHFFAGIGVWSRALRLAGWPDERRVWTGSCPCQPFSSAGKGAGFADERHLWPAFHHLISECRPPVVFGEQVASKDGLQWLDLVRTDLEASSYAVGASDLCAAGVGAPHIRQRLWWVADAGGGSVRWGRELGEDAGATREIPGEVRQQRVRSDARADCPDGWVADACEAGRGEQCAHHDRGAEVDGGPSTEQCSHDAGRGADGGVDNNNNTGLEGQRFGHCAQSGREGSVRPVAEAGESVRMADAEVRGQPVLGSALEQGDVRHVDSRHRELDRPSPTHGFWRDADWLFCRDGKWRPVEPGTFPLADGAPARVGRLRAYGNAIVPQVAETFIRAYLDCRS